MWSSASMGPLGPDLRGDVLPIFHERTRDYGRKGILDIYFVTLPGWIMFDTYNIIFLFIQDIVEYFFK